MKKTIHNRYAQSQNQKLLKDRPWGERELSDELSVVLDAIKGRCKTVLDVGFGCTMRSTKALAKVLPEATIIAIDNSAAALESVAKLESGLKRVHFWFGDPEFALPKMEGKFDLVVLSMVLHCFDYPYRALGNLIKHAISKEGYMLFVHRTDPFMKAVCGLPIDGGGNDAAREVEKIWKDKVPPGFHYRLICEHARAIEGFMLEAGFKHIWNPSSAEIKTEKKESVKQVLQQRRYAPLDLLSADADYSGIDEDIKNDKVKFEFHLYKRQYELEDLPQISSLVDSAPFYDWNVEKQDIKPLLLHEKVEDENVGSGESKILLQDLGEKAKEWFTVHTKIGDKVLKYGHYIDMRFTDPKQGNQSLDRRYQLWSETPLDLSWTDTSISVLGALTEYPKEEIKKAGVVAFCWVYIPSGNLWAKNGYEIMEGVVDVRTMRAKGTDDIQAEKPRWYLLPYSDKNEAKDVIVKEIKNILLEDKDDLNLVDRVWQYLQGITEKLKKEDIVVTWYFVFREAPRKKPSAFSIHATRWLGVKEVLWTGSVAQAGFAAINDEISSRYSLEANEYDSIKDNVQKLMADVGTMFGVAKNISEINEVLDPEYAAPGTEALEEFSDRLNEPGVVFDPDMGDGDRHHRPFQFEDNNDLWGLLGEGASNKALSSEKARAKETYEKVRGKLCRSGEDRDDRFHKVAEKLFEPFEREEKANDADGENDEKFKKPLPSLCLAKSLRDGMPYAWVIAALSPEMEAPAWCWRFRIEIEQKRRLRLLRAMSSLADQLVVKEVDIGKERKNSEAEIIVHGTWFCNTKFYDEFKEFIEGFSKVHGAESKKSKKEERGTLTKAMRWLTDDCRICIHPHPANTERNDITEEDIRKHMKTQNEIIGCVAFPNKDKISVGFQVRGFETR